MLAKKTVQDEEQTDDKMLSLLPDDPRKDLSFKAGFVSLQERVSRWTRQASTGSPDVAHNEASFVEAFKREHHHQPTVGESAAPQFASLHEFFQSKASLRKQLEQEDLMRRQRRPQIPIMKLSKDDWNVKCWEERFKPLGAQRRAQMKNKENSQTNSSSSHQQEPNRAKKPDSQVEVFHGRIDEVAKKLDRMREGAPQDEQLYKLEKNKLREPERGHSWTDLLKNELTRGVHNPKVLRSELDRNHKTASKSPLGRPIGRICQDDDDDDD